MSCLRECVSEKRITKLAILSEVELQPLLVVGCERVVRMVEEIVGRDAELHLPGLVLSKWEVFEQCQITVKKAGARQRREDVVPVAADGRRRETGTIDVLVRRQV